MPSALPIARAIPGKIEIFEAKRGKVFCEVDGPKVADGSYKIQTINGTKVLALDFPKHIDRRDIGIHSSESGALDFAFIEVKKPHAQVFAGPYPATLSAHSPITNTALIKRLLKASKML